MILVSVCRLFADFVTSGGLGISCLFLHGGLFMSVMLLAGVLFRAYCFCLWLALLLVRLFVLIGYGVV